MPTALLVRRALLGMEAERAGRQRAVAERVFDEMERSLSAWLAAEDTRPPREYAFYLEADRRSPLSHPEALSDAPGFVLGRFVADARGLRSPRLPGPDEEPHARRRGEMPSATVRAEVRRTLVLARRALAESEGAAPRSASQAPGTTQVLAPEGGPGGRVGIAEEALPDAYDALQSLNRGARLREERVARAPEKRKAAAPVEAADRGGTAKRDADRPAADAAAAPRGPAPPAPPKMEGASPPGLDASAEAAPARAPEPVIRSLPHGLGDLVDPRRPPPVREADPFHDRLVDEDHLVLVRTVVVAGQASRQGLVLDVARLGTFLEREVLGASALQGASFRLLPAGARPIARGGAPAYRHRFAEPFDALAADLVLPPLAGGSGAGTVWALAGLLAVAGVAGLAAVERMVSVAVAFAERRSRFVAAVSHELKTPLTAIRLHGEMLRDGMVGDDAKRAAAYATITAEAERLSRLIGNVLELSRLERDDRPVEAVAGPVAPVLEELAESLRPHLAREGFALELDVDPALPPARFDRDALLQVLFNLVDNAVKYAREGTERRIRLEARPAPRGGVALSVRDFGPGVAGRELPRVFEAFHRGEGALVRRTGGTGIGLALVRGLVERMGGAVEGRNAPGGGFEVRLRLPAA